MQLIRTLTVVLAFVLMSSTVICGLWIRFSGKADDSSVAFHMNIALATVAVVTAAIVMLMKR